MMEIQLPLHNTTVLITRPKPFAEELQVSLENAGARTVLLPIFKIHPSSQQVELAQRVDQLSNFDVAVFISRNAVRHTWPLIRAQWPKSPRVVWAAIGNSTAQDLKAMGADPILSPPHPPYNSEHFLSLPTFHEDLIQGKKIIIFRGDKGRTLLADTLKSRGAEVTLVETYIRTPSDLSAPDLQQLYSNWDEPLIDVIVATSADGLAHLSQLTHFVNEKNLNQIPVLVVSERMLIKARDLGFKTCILAESPDNSAILHALLNWKGPILNTNHVP